MLEGDTDSVGRQSALAGVPALLPLLEAGSAVDELRELIAVPASIEQGLRAFALAHPEDEPLVDRPLMFRKLSWMSSIAW